MSNASLMNLAKQKFLSSYKLCCRFIIINRSGWTVDTEIDLLVEDRVIVELKSIDQLLKIHEAQVLTYMKLAGLAVALLINFNVDALKKRFRRFVL